MPLIKPSGEEGAQRTTFRPPWVKEGPSPLPMPSAPWLPKRRESQPQQQPVQNKAPPGLPLKKDQGQDKQIPVQRQDTKPERNIPVQRQDTKPERNIPVQRQDTKPEKNIPVQRQDTKPEKNAVPIQRQDTKPEKNVTSIPIQRQDTKPEKNVTTIPVQRQDNKTEKNIAVQRQDTKAEKNTAVQRQDTKPEKNIAVQRQDTKPERNAVTIPVQRQDIKPEKNVSNAIPVRKDSTQEKPISNAVPARKDSTQEKPPPVVPLQKKETQERNKKNIPIQRMDAIDGKNMKNAPLQRADTIEAKNITNVQNQKQEPIKGKDAGAAARKEEAKPPICKETPKPEKKDEIKKKVQISEEPKILSIKEMERPPAPPAPPMPPPPPPMAPTKPPIDTKPLTSNQKVKLEALKSRPRRRPDWTDMMKEVEEGVKLKHIQCNDRSAPVLPKAKAKGQFVYESEKQNAHNLLLKEIQGGVRLKKTKCNDRSKPILDGLRKFRRQMTIEEQIVKKSTSMADVVAMAAQPDELDDIDKVRDDLQSTKQMLAHELRNKETLERENKRLMARLLNLEAELEKEKSSRNIEKERGEIEKIRTADDDKLITKLKEEASESGKMMKEMEDMYKKTAEELDVTRAKLESAWLQNAQLEQELKNIHNHPDAPVVLPRLPSSKKLANASFSARPSVLMSSSEEESEEEESEEESESGEEDDGANATAQQEKRIARELKLMTAKHRTLREKRLNAKKEKTALKHQFSNLTKCLNDEKKKYRQLQKEVDKMAKLVKDVDEDEEEEEDDEEDEETEESESENESEESEGSEASEGELPESASSQDRISNLTRRVKVYENRLTTLKKCNYLLKANIDRRQDEINKQKEVILSLQEDLNAVLAELG